MVDISLNDTEHALKEGAILIDIRRPEEVAGITATGARVIQRDMLEIELDRDKLPADTKLLLLCQSGLRSRYAARALRHLGWPDCWSVTGGFAAWTEANLPQDQLPYLSPEDRERYARHISLPEIGVVGQSRLAQSRITVIGAGGLGAPALLYLAAMGVGFIRLVDDDSVELSNLQRQVIHSEQTLGQPKVQSAADKMRALNGAITVETVERRFEESCVDLVSDVDLVLNGADNFKVRYLLNDICLELGKPFIDGSVLEMEGQLSVLCHPEGGPCYRCLYPEPPPKDLAPSCVAAGVLGVVPGTIGILQALETAKILTGFGEPLVGRLLTFDAINSRFEEIAFKADPTCICARTKRPVKDDVEGKRSKN